MSELTARLATAEDKVTALKGERSRLYQQMAAAADASRNPVGGPLLHPRALASCSHGSAQPRAAKHSNNYPLHLSQHQSRADVAGL